MRDAMRERPRIVLIHATPLAVEPIRDAFAREWPGAETVNILDDSLSADRAAATALTPELTARFDALAAYAVSIGARAILFTCSAFGPAIEAIARRMTIPVLKPNEAMFEEALSHGDAIGMVATFAPSIPTMEAEFREDAARIRPGARIESRLAAGGMDDLRAGDVATHNRKVANEAARLAGADAIMLAQFSTARALETVRAASPLPVLTSPDAAVRKLRRLIIGS